MGPDFCLVQLTAAGIKLAHGAPLRISNGRTVVTFITGRTVKVARYEWDMLLRNHHTHDGKSLFELVPETPAAATEENAQ